MKYATVTALRDAVVSNVTPEYRGKMYHPIPNLPTVKDRAAYLVAHAKAKTVLDIGCTGPISAAIRGVAKRYYGFDKESADGIEAVELDHHPELMPVHDDVEIVICSEVLEHLANPGLFLMALKKHYPRKTYFTVPNAGTYKVVEDCEIVNGDHVAWYSYQTLLTLLTRYEYRVTLARWYNGQPYTAEGLIMVAE